MPTEAAEAISDLGYDAFLDDICRGLAAMKAGSVEACDSIDVSAMKRACRRRVALLSGQIDACPEALGIEGRDPTCVAWAARRPGLCEAASTLERALCRALFANEKNACRELRGADRERCLAEWRRYHGALAGAKIDKRAVEATDLVAKVTMTPKGGEAITKEAAPQSLARGVRAEAKGCAFVVALSDPLTRRLPIFGLGDAPPRVEVTLQIPRASEETLPLDLGPSGSRVRAEWPSKLSADSLIQSEGSVELDPFTVQVGEPLTGRIHTTLKDFRGTLEVEGEFKTYFRDVSGRLEGCAE